MGAYKVYCNAILILEPDTDIQRGKWERGKRTVIKAEILYLLIFSRGKMRPNVIFPGGGGWNSIQSHLSRGGGLNLGTFFQWESQGVCPVYKFYQYFRHRNVDKHRMDIVSTLWAFFFVYIVHIVYIAMLIDILSTSYLFFYPISQTILSMQQC